MKRGKMFAADHHPSHSPCTYPSVLSNKLVKVNILFIINLKFTFTNSVITTSVLNIFLS